MMLSIEVASWSEDYVVNIKSINTMKYSSHQLEKQQRITRFILKVYIQEEEHHDIPLNVLYVNTQTLGICTNIDDQSQL